VEEGTEALLSVGQESNIKDIEEALAANIPLLILGQVTRSATEFQKPFPVAFMVEYKRDNHFIGRRVFLMN